MYIYIHIHIYTYLCIYVYITCGNLLIGERRHLIEFRRAAEGRKEVRCRWDFPKEVASMEARDAGSQHSLIRGRKTRMSSGAILCRGGDTRDPGILDHLPSASLAGQELDLVAGGHFAYPTLPGSKVKVLRGHRGGHGEVLEDGGEEEE